jgi:SAM-dependent methyltransferase
MASDNQTAARDLLSPEYWELAAEGWERQAKAFAQFTAPLSQRMVEEINPQPGQVILEVGCGPAEVGLLAAELVRPGGKVVISDRSEQMVAAARRRAQQLGLDNVECKVLDAEWLDLPLASVDGLLMRFVLMFLVDPEAALRECRRVLKSGGRAAIAVWDEEGVNPWAAAVTKAVREVLPRGDGPPVRGSAFSAADRNRLAELIEGAGFFLLGVEPVELVERSPDLETFWQRRVDLSPSLRERVKGITEAQQALLLERLGEELAPYRQGDGSLAVPGRALLAVAEA